MAYYLGIDLGTTTIKVAAFDDNLNMVATAFREVQVINCDDGSIHQDLVNWYELPCQLIREIGNTINLNDVKALSVSSQGLSFAPVNEKFIPMSDAICWLDVSAENEMQYINSIYDENKMYELTGKHSNCQYSLPKIIKFIREHKDIYEKAYKILLPLDYLNARFTGNALTDVTMASGTMLYNLEKKCWDDEIIKTFGLNKEKLPDVAIGGSLVGYINKETSDLSGLGENVAVVLGAQDQKIAAYGANLSSTQPTLSLGTAGALEFLIDKPVRSDFGAFPYFGDKYVLEGCINTAGAGVKWVRDTFCHGMSYKEMDELAKESKLGCNGVSFCSCFSGRNTPHVDNTVKASISNITLGTTLADIIRALYEGIGYEIKNNIDAIKEFGYDIDSLAMFGGGSKSEVMKNIFQEICGVKIQRLDNPEMALEGAARLAKEFINK